MTDDDVDLVVVGAGPTGSAAALRARQLDPDARILLLDRVPFPRDKPCGDGVGPDGVDVLRRLRVADEVLAGYPAIRRIAVRSPAGLVAQGLAPRAGHVVPRHVLDARLRQAAVDRGVRALTHRVRRLEQRDDHVVVDGLRDALPGVDVPADTLRAHHLPLSTARPAPTHGRVLLAGDAASLVHPMTGEGIYYGLLSGVLAGAAAVRFPRSADRAYRAGLRRRLGRHLRHTTVAARLFRWQLPVDASVAVAAERPDVLDELCEFALATGVITGAMVRSLTRHAVRHRRAAGPGSVQLGPSGPRGDR